MANLDNELNNKIMVRIYNGNKALKQKKLREFDFLPPMDDVRLSQSNIK